MLTTYRAFLAAYFAFAIIVVVWNVAVTGRLVANRRAPEVLTGLTAFGALLLVPGLIVAISAASIVYGRAIQPIAWVWPAVTILFALQAAVALGRGLVNPVLGIPILVYDVIVAVVATARYLNVLGVAPPDFALVLSAAQSSALGVVGGTAALSRASWLLVPLFSPARPSRSRLRLFVRSALVIGVTIATALVVIEIPVAVETIRSYGRYEHATLQERPAGDFSFGLKVFPELRSAPPPLALTNDLSLADSIGLEAVEVIVDPEAARGKPLDSLAHVLDDLRADSVMIVVVLGYPANGRQVLQRNEAAYVDARLADVNRIARALRPAVLIPAHEPYGEGTRTLGIRPPRFWIDYIQRAAVIAHHVNPNIRVGVAASSYGTRDSTLYAWAAARGAPVDIVGFSLMPGFDGVTSLDTHLRIARRWMHMYDRPKPHWVWSAGGYPVAHGERSQVLALRGIFAWATSQPEVEGVVVTEAGDYEAQRGLRAPGGRLRPALNEVTRTVNAIRESAR